MKISNRAKLPEWMPSLARQAPIFAELIRSHPQVAGRLHKLMSIVGYDCIRRPVAQRELRTVGYPLSTLYAWEDRSNDDPASLANGSRRRKTAPQRTARTPEVRAEIKHFRGHFVWGIEKLWKTLRWSGHQISMASVGRVLQELLENNEIKRIRFRKDPEARKGMRKRNRKPRYCKRGIPAKAGRVGQLIKMDMMYVGLPCGGKIYYISAVDVYSRRIWSRIYTSPSASNAADLLRQTSKDVDIEQIQVDGGSESRCAFETACKQICLLAFPRVISVECRITQG